MKANEAKRKFVYPDKLYARTNDNITLDISYAPQTLEAVEYIRTDALLKKAEEFFEDHLTEEDCKFGSSEWVEVKTDFGSIDLFMRAFRNYMKGE